MTRLYVTNPAIARTDFNRHDVHGRYTVSMKRFRDGLIPTTGDEVLLHDPEGNSVRAIVADATAQVALVDPVWATWWSAPVWQDLTIWAARPRAPVRVLDTSREQPNTAIPQRPVVSAC